MKLLLRSECFFLVLNPPGRDHPASVARFSCGVEHLGARVHVPSATLVDGFRNAPATSAES